MAVRADMADPEQVSALFDQAESAFGGVDVAVSSAGIMRPALIAGATGKDFTKRVEVNVRGTFRALREAARHARDGGRILTLSSTTLALNAPGYGMFSCGRRRHRRRWIDHRNVLLAT